MSEQTATDKANAELQKEATVEAGSVQDDLDTLLQEYDTSTKPAPETKPQKTALEQWAEREMAKQQRHELQDGIKSAVEQVKGGLGETPVKITDTLIEGFLHKRAADDPRVQQAFQEREANPQNWNRILSGIGKDLKDELSIDTSATQDRAAVEAAVSGTKTTDTEPDAPDYANMSDEDFAKITASLPQ
jgi:hypothetical protein